MGGTPSWVETTVKKMKKKTGRNRKQNVFKIGLPVCYPHGAFCVPAADSEDQDEEEDDDLLRRTGNFVASSHSLPSGILRVSRRRCHC